MTPCGVNVFEPNRCPHEAQPNDPLCRDHAALASARAFSLDGRGTAGQRKIARVAEQRLRGGGAW